MSNFIIYKVIGWTNPLDWSSSSEASTLGYYQTRFGAEDKVADMKNAVDWRYTWNDFEIVEIEVNP